ncbi:MAG: FecR domain-containing protein [Candidatus Riflebacteria bacterium]|nr:FecR domain-containing protein [Candidatus Riflebacteria bacterium]
MRHFFLIVLAAGLLLAPALAGEATPLGTFIKGSTEGCFLGGPNGWNPLTEPKVPFFVGTRLKTEGTGWGTLAFPFGSIVLRGDSEVRIEPAGLFLQRGTYQAFVRRTPQGFKFRIPSATLSVRGTVFTVAGEGGLQVDAGTVEVTAGGEAGTPVTAGNGWGTPVAADATLPTSLQAFEAALRAEHDGKPAEAISGFLDLLDAPSLSGLPVFQEHLVEKALVVFGEAGLPADHPLTARLRAAVGRLPEAWYGALENALAADQAAAAQRLLGFAAAARGGGPPDQRELVARALLAEMTLNDQVFEKLVDKLGATPTPAATPQPKPSEFWSSSRTFLQALHDPRVVAPERLTQMIAPAALARLTPRAAASRVALASRLPAETLEAQGLYYLVKALRADGKNQQADQAMAWFRAHHAGSPWLERAEKLLARVRSTTRAQVKKVVGKATTATVRNLPKPTPTASATKESLAAATADTFGASPEAGGEDRSGPQATGTTTLSSQGQEAPAWAAESLGDSF